MLSLPLTLALAATQAPSATAPATAPAAPAYASHWGGRLFISPMGEPFRPNGRNDDTLADWFRQANRSHDGKLTLGEMQQDAERFFATLDVNHDGEIDPDEITRYEDTVAPEIQSGTHFGIASLEGGSDGHHRGGGFFRGDDRDEHQGAGRFGLIDLPEPVVSADADFDRGVSLAEFRQAAGQRFLALDIDHHGYLTLAVLETIRPAPPAAPKAPERPKTDDTALPDQN